MSEGRALLRARQFFEPRQRSQEGWSERSTYARDWEEAYRRRWQHDRVVRSTHGVNCTGSCSWKIHVKGGLVTWETQQTDYPTNGAETPDYEPRGCPRGASFSWYLYSPLRPKYPYVRGVLLELYREARERLGDPVEAWASIVSDPDKARAYKSRRGKGGFVRASWEEAAEIIAAAHVHTIRRHGPDRVAGFSPIPAMSMVSYSAGTRFLSLIGGVCLSFYDWYADLPPASPQIWGDQTDVPESADWWNSTYLMLWGSNIPQTRTPDAHFMTEARYKGQKVVVVSPDYAGHTKFADDWLPARAGTDGALAMAMGHVILREFHVERSAPHFQDYVKRFTDLPHLVTLREREDGSVVPGAFLRAADLGEEGENASWKTVVLDSRDCAPHVPDGSIGFRWGEEGVGRWNLDLGVVDPLLSLIDHAEATVPVTLPRFDGGDSEGGTTLERGVPVRRLGGRLVTTVYDLTLAHYGVSRPGLPGDWPESYEDPQPGTPAWQQALTGVDADVCIRVAREFAENAERTGGRSMIVMGAGTNHWFHSDQTYRTMLSLVLFCGCQGVNGGGWAHYVGQEKVRPLTGWSTVAFGLDWSRPPRQQPATPYWYLATDQWRYETFDAGEFSSPAGNGALAGRHTADLHALAARLGWLPSYPTFDRNPLDLADEARAAGREPADHVVDQLRSGELGFAAEDPDDPANFPRVLTLWRANLLGSSSKGHEYFLKHLLGVPDAAVRSQESGPEQRPGDVRWHERAPEGKLDLFTTIDFRMNGSCLYSDVVLPAATWYEKHDLSSTDLHPFVHPFNAAVPPPWEARSDWDAFNAIAERFSELAAEHLGTRTDIVAAPLQHDTPDELAQPGGLVRDWRAGQCDPVPGRTMPRLVAVERDYARIHEKMRALGPLVEEAGIGAKGISWKPAAEVEELRARNGTADGDGPAAGRPRLLRDRDVCETILALSGTTNGRIAVESFKALEARVGRPLAAIPEERADDRISFSEITAQPRKVIASAEWSGLESRERRYSPFTANLEHLIPWRTLTGRQQLYVDHEWLLDLGEGLPVYRPPVDAGQLQGLGGEPEAGEGVEITVRYLTPHSKWSIHSEFQDNLQMLTLFRGGPAMWLSGGDAERIGVEDNDWLEVYNKHGTVACRAIVSHRVPDGVALFYHSQDRHVNVPVSEISGSRGGTDNSLTRIAIKPSHLIGGYAQLSWAFNYYGPTGPQRDQLIIVRKRRTEVSY